MSWRVDFSDDAAVQGNIAWAKRRLVPWLLLIQALGLVTVGLLAGPVAAVAAGVFAAGFYAAITPFPVPVRAAAAAVTAVALLVLMGAAR